MQRTITLAIAGVMMAVGLAGCVSEDPAARSKAASAPDAPPAQDLGNIAGLVVDDTQIPLSGVVVALLEANTDVTVLTDENGGFQMRDLEPRKYRVGFQKLGYQSVVKLVDVVADQVTNVQVELLQIAVRGTPYYNLLIGDGYFACGAYTPVVTWGNLHACVWDEHRPRFTFDAPMFNLMGISQEIVWTQNTALTAKKLQTYLQYNPVCDPFCSADKTYQRARGESPIRQYTDFEDEAEDFEEEVPRLASMTFPAGDGVEVVIIFQQRMTHFVTLFYNEHGDLDKYSGIPDQ